MKWTTVRTTRSGGDYEFSCTCICLKRIFQSTIGHNDEHFLSVAYEKRGFAI